MSQSQDRGEPSRNQRQEKFKDEIKECSGYQYSQSSKVSTLGRTIIYAIIGLIWAFSYDGESQGFSLPNTALIWAFFLALSYLIIDITHYFIDTIDYHILLHILERKKIDINDIPRLYDKRKDCVEDVSFASLMIKFSLMLITAGVFIRGMLIKFALICN